jgi:FkbM family methyltransferase
MTMFYRAIGALCPTAFGLDFKVVGRLHRRTGLDPARALRCANGFLMTGDTSNAAYISGVNEGAYMRLLARLVTPGSRVYDVGANTGYLALWLAQHFRGSLSVIGFEADPRTAAWMSRNVMLNPALDVQVEPFALGDDEGTAVLHSSGAGDGAASLGKRFASGSADSIEVSVRRLDAYQAGRADPDWLILDVEGFGGAVLRGGAVTLARARPAVAVEIHSDGERADVLKTLHPLGYTMRAKLQNIWGTHEIYMTEARAKPASS